MTAPVAGRQRAPRWATDEPSAPQPRRARHSTTEALVGHQVIAVVNFPPRQIGKFLSQVLTLGVPDAVGEVVLLHLEQPVPNGGRLF